MQAQIMFNKTMDITMIDTLQLAKKAKEAGFNEQQAEFYAESLAGILERNLASKTDIKELERNIKVDMQKLERDIKTLELNIKQLEVALKRDMKELEYRLLIKLGAMLTISIGILASIIKLF